MRFNSMVAYAASGDSIVFFFYLLLVVAPIVRVFVCWVLVFWCGVLSSPAVILLRKIERDVCFTLIVLWLSVFSASFQWWSELVCILLL